LSPPEVWASPEPPEGWLPYAYQAAVSLLFPAAAMTRARSIAKNFLILFILLYK
jgi:hypothetical protein